MSMKLKLEVLNDDEFVKALRSLAGQRINAKTAYKIGRIINKVESQVREKREDFRALVKKYAKVDEKGEMIPSKDGNGVELIADKKDEYDREFKKFLAQEIELPWEKVSIKELGTVNLAPQEAMALDPILTELSLAE